MGMEDIMTDREYIRKEIAENVRDLEQILTVYQHIKTEAIVKSLEKVIFNFTCVVSGYYYDINESTESITD